MDDIEWLKKLQEDLWPPEPEPRITIRGMPKLKIALDARRPLTKAEFERVLFCIGQHRLVAEMFSSNMFGGYGMRLYDHELYPGTGAQFLITLVEDHLPVPTRYDHIAGNVKERPQPKQGCGRADAWEVFSKFTHAEQNVEWLKKYGLSLPQNQAYYDY